MCCDRWGSIVLLIYIQTANQAPVLKTSFPATSCRKIHSKVQDHSQKQENESVKLYANIISWFSLAIDTHVDRTKIDG